MQIIHKRLSDNHEITVCDTPILYGEQGNFRVLQFSNEDVQGAIDLNNPDRIVLEYPRAIIHLMKNNNAQFEDVFVIGHGIGTISGYFADKRFTVAELDQEVVELSQKYFGYQQSNVVVGDGRYILSKEESAIFDYIILDAFTSEGTPRHLISREFFTTTADKLVTKGALLINVIGKGGNDALINAIHSTLGEVFTYIKSFSLPPEGIKDTLNILLMASNEPIKFQERHMAGFREIALGQGHIIMDKK